jgi:hypothetical protein
VDAASRKRASLLRVSLVGVAVLAAVLLGLLAQPGQAQSPNQQCNVNNQGHFICIDKTASPNPATVGQPIIFTITVTIDIQPGQGIGFFAGIRDTVPPSLTIVSAEASGGFQPPPPCTVTDSTVDCTVPVNEENPATVTIEAIPTQCGDFANSAFEIDEGPTSTAHFTVVGCEETPKSKAECKNGGYKEFGFKNQGQCHKTVNSPPKQRTR